MARSLIRASACKQLAMLLVACIALVNSKADAVVLAQWSFENFPDASQTVVPASGVVPEAGVFAATSAASVNTGGTVNTVAGPASTNSYSSNGWSVGEYWQFSTSSDGYEDITISFDATGSNTGPRDFKVAYSTNGTTFSDFANYTLVNASWSASPSFVNPATAHFAFDLSGVPLIDDATTLFFRLILRTTTAINGTTTAATGTSRVDNFTVSGDLIPPPSGVPLPSSLLVFGGCAGIAGVARRRLQSIFA